MIKIREASNFIQFCNPVIKSYSFRNQKRILLLNLSLKRKNKGACTCSGLDLIENGHL